MQDNASGRSCRCGRPGQPDPERHPGFGRLTSQLRTGGKPQGTENCQCRERIGYSAATIRSWLARGLPRDNPFPEPHKHLGRNVWDENAIHRWQAREKLLEAERKNRDTGNSG